MPKFQTLEEAFWDIRDNPRDYLPEKSLALFDAFWIGYEWRYEVEFRDYKGFDLLDGFHEFMCRKYRVPSNRSSFGIVNLYSDNQANAFDLWFKCVEDFRAIGLNSPDLEFYYRERRSSDPFPSRKEMDLFSLIRSMTKRVSMFVGTKSFTLLTFVLDGWVRATQDFGLVESDQEITYRRFKAYIESKPHWLRAEIENPSLPAPPSWRKLILEWTAHENLEEKAIEKFAEYFDEFAFQGKGYVDRVEFHWKNHLEHVTECPRLAEINT